MPRLLRFLAPGLVAAGLAGPAAAQTTTGDTSGSTGSSSGLGGSSTLGGSSSLGGSSGSAFGTGSNTYANPVTISPPSQVQTTNAMAPSNQFGRYYANVYYQGASAAGSTTGSTSTIVNPGGFNSPTYGNTSTGGGRSGGSSGSNSGFSSASTGFTGSTGTAGRVGGSAGSTGFGSTAGGSTTGFTSGATANRAAGGLNSLGTSGSLGGGVNQQNSGLISPRPINYTATFRFPVSVPTPVQMATQLRGIVDASAVSNPRNVQITTEPGGLVVLRGPVADEDEARTVEGMLRLTPGVREVKNELTYPAPVAAK